MDFTGIPPSWNLPRDNLFCFTFCLDLLFSIQHYPQRYKLDTNNPIISQTNNLVSHKPSKYYYLYKTALAESPILFYVILLFIVFCFFNL